MGRFCASIYAIAMVCTFSIAECVTMRGYVYDGAKEVPLRGANVVIKGTAKWAVTGETGEFKLIDLVPGKYDLVISHTGYKEELININLTKDTTLEIPMEPKVYKLHPIAVTATRMPTLISLTPAVSYTLRGEELNRVNPDVTDEVLNFIPGVYLKRSKGISDIMPKIYLRGFEVRAVPGPGSRAVVLVDGTPLLDWNRIPTTEIERIEVSKGPYSALYGANAMGGVLNIITRTKAGVKGRAEAGENGSSILDLSFGKRMGKLGLYGSLGTHYTNGYVSNYTVAYTRSTTDTTIPLVTGFKKTKDPKGNTKYLIGDYGKNWYKDLIGHFKILYCFSPWNILGAKLGVSTYNYGYKGGKSWLKTLDGEPATQGDFRIDNYTKVHLSPTSFRSTYGAYPIYSSSLFFKCFAKGVRISGNISVAQGQYWYASPYAYISTTNFSSFSGNLIGIYDKEKYSILWGVESKSIKEKKTQQELSNWEDPQSKGDIKYENSGGNLLWGTFSQLICKPLNLLTFYIGLRYDNWKFSNGKSKYKKGDQYIESSYPEKRKSALSPRIGIVLTPLSSTIAYFSYGKAFRSPTEYELYNEWAYFSTLYKGNPYLDPENNWLTEVGITQGIVEKLSLNFSCFTGKMEDMIDSRYLDSLEVAKYNQEHGTNFKKIKEKANIAKVETKGFELGFKVIPLKFLKFDFGLGYNDLKVIENPENTRSIGKQVTHVPKFTYFGSTTLSKYGASFALFVRYRSKVYGEPDNSDTLSGVYKSYDPYTIVDITIRYNITSNIRLTAKVSNLLNKEYYDYYRMPGRKLKGGVELEF